MGRKLFLMMVVFCGTQPFLFSQTTDTITDKEAGRIIRYLASDSLKGRGDITPELLTAALFVGNEFRKSGLQPLPGLPNYYIPFRPNVGDGFFVMDQLLWNGTKLSPHSFMFLHQQAGNYADKTLENFTVVKADSFFIAGMLENSGSDTTSLLLWTDRRQPMGKNVFPESFDMPAGGLHRDILLVYAENPPVSLSLTGFPSQYLTVDYNVVGVLPGHSKANEVIIFSAHYDHIGTYGEGHDNIFNGANDNASGTTALLLLAQYFAKRNDNERTIMFCAFAGEELGLLGSSDLIKYVNPEKISAGINIEMIGVTQYGRNRVFIIGEAYSDLPGILRKGLKSNGISTTTEPARSKQLFQRSDNYSFALKGVPFHTIMASDDDDDCYHKPCDEIRRIDVANMTRIIRAIAGSAMILINGTITPRRINPRSVEIKR
jgi:hypothetical protein